MPLPPTPLGTRFFERILNPGDLILYRGTSIWSKLLMIKTWSPVSHCEVYLGNGKSYSARDGVGVDFFPLRLEGLTHVLRPIVRAGDPFDFKAGVKWAETTRGQKYDWLGLFRFFTLGKQSLTKQFCSEACLRFYRNCQFEPFHKDKDADLIAPGNFLDSPAFEHWWVRKDS